MKGRQGGYKGRINLSGSLYLTMIVTLTRDNLKDQKPDRIEKDTAEQNGKHREDGFWIAQDMQRWGSLAAKDL